MSLASYRTALLRVKAASMGLEPMTARFRKPALYPLSYEAVVAPVRIEPHIGPL